MLPIDGELLREIMPRVSGAKAAAQRRIVETISGHLQPVLARHGIDTPLRIAHFLAQVTHECDGFCTTEEYASGRAYEGRLDLGNTQRGDGVRYKGRGLLQLTGRANYRTIGARLGLPLEAEPERAAEPVVSLVIACDYWKHRGPGGINPAADRDDLIAVTRAVNGGLNGLDDRRRYLGKAKTAVARIAATVIGARPAPDDRPVLRRGIKSELVAELQALLRAKGYPVAVDNDFGPSTETAVRHFQGTLGLAPDGIVGPVTWAALES